MKTIARLFVLSAVILAAGFVHPGHAYVLDTDGRGHNLSWNKSTVKYRVGSGNVPGGTAGENAVRNAFNAWSAVSTNLNYVFDGYVANPSQSFDRRNVVYWVHQGWSWDPNLLAVTFRYFDDNGTILDADIVFNAQRYDWSVGGSSYDVQNSATHEVGHFGGLGHSGDSRATMFASARPGEVSKRNLSNDDVAGLNALYGGAVAGAASATGGVVSSSPSGVSGGGGGGGCSIGMNGPRGASGDFFLVALLLGGIALRRIRPRRADAVRGLSPHGSIPSGNVQSLTPCRSRRASDLMRRSAHNDRLLGSDTRCPECPPAA